MAYRLCSVAFVTLPVLAACSDLDTTRRPRPELSVGAEIYATVCERVAYDDDPSDVSGSSTRATCLDGQPPPEDSGPRLRALHRERGRLVAALDRLIPASLSGDLGDLLREIIPLYDRGVVQSETRALSELLAQVAGDPETVATLERFGARQGYRPLALTSGALRSLLRHPNLRAAIEEVLRTIGTGGTAEGAWRQTLAALKHDFANQDPDAPGADPSGFSLTRDLLFSSASSFADGAPRLLARRDGRGVVIPRDLNAPFADGNDDGLADIGPSGDFVDGNGTPINPGPPFRVSGEAKGVPRDVHDRLLDAGGGLVYDYVDTSGTLLGALLRDVRDVASNDPSGLTGLLARMEPVFGHRELVRHSYPDGSEMLYDGHATWESPLLDIAYVAGLLADEPEALEAVRAITLVAQTGEPGLAAIVSSLSLMGDLLEEPYNAAASMEPNNIFFDELLALLVEIARIPGLFEDVIASMRHPASRTLGFYFAREMRHKDFVTYDPENINAPAVGELVTPVDRTRPDTGSNQSAFQRLLHLVRDGDETKYCNKKGAVLKLGPVTYPLFGTYDECELIEVNNVSAFYLRSIVGKAVLQLKDPLVEFSANFDSIFETLTGINGFTRNPTPQALNRLLLVPHNAFVRGFTDPVPTIDGGTFFERHQGSAFAWEEEGFYPALTPLVNAFVNKGRGDLLVKVFSTMHMHYASPLNDATQAANPSAPKFSNQSAMVRLEPLLASIYDEADIIGAIAELCKALEVELPSGITAEKAIAELLRVLLLPERQPGLTYRDGRDVAVMSDGVTIVPELSLAYVLLDALGDFFDAFEGQDEDPAAEGFTSRFIDQVVDVTGGGDTRRFTNRRFTGMLETLTRFMSSRIEAHQVAGDMTEWGQSFPDRLEDTLADPVVSTAVTLLTTIGQDPAARVELDDWLASLFNTPEAFDSSSVAAADFLQILEDDANLVPVLNRTASAFDPDTGLVRQTIAFLEALDDLDDTEVIPRLLANAVAEIQTSQGLELVYEVILDVAVEVNRADPNAGIRPTAADYVDVLGATTSFLDSDESGIERLFALIEDR